jgi:holo-[acyl-carrier protein] synthase
MIVGIGLDLAEVARYRFSPERLAHFARKIYTEEELTYALSKRNSAERFAGFFAAKEAARKAFGIAFPWRSIGVSHDPTGKPFLRFEEAARKLMRPQESVSVHLTITHTTTTAAATVILERNACVS